MNISVRKDGQSCTYISRINGSLVIADECFPPRSKFRFSAGLEQVKKPSQRDGQSGLTSGLSPFAKMVLDGADIAFNCEILLVFLLK